ncbi:erythrocyte membrane protein 1, PfEMP1, putative [Plasmodium sp. gorilla clade G2]|uniref:erythrocyte membrane protein 1, PfEMP1, putative n=1 Tax=Plasmodium sp. gorilla clade G2 TaxID=880535 RepID=UPI000D29182C|nr:erythrocyte membrane protein 1, PfEMP1, putative [Plasmodium sp. gorilla clade G2]SOV20384.1 erythrocyte membrane protein 1, PfEMP1, putative [Plasmodium sp. gorilla clade G2]
MVGLATLSCVVELLPPTVARFTHQVDPRCPTHHYLDQYYTRWIMLDGEASGSCPISDYLLRLCWLWPRKTSGYKEKCGCVTSQVVPGPQPQPQPGNTNGQDPDSSPSQHDPSSGNTDPNSGGGTPGQPDGTPGQGGGSNPSGNPTKPPENMNCVEEAANEIRKEAEKTVNSVKDKLQGKKTEDVYKTTQNDGWNNSEICKINDNNAGQTNTCNNNENPFDVEKEKWDCDNDTLKVANQHICLPPRRKHMCLTPLENIDTQKTTTSDALFKEVLRTAANEGKHLKDKWDKASDPKMKTQICDAMKYSFADIGDIIRGTDKYNGNNNQIEENLKTIFGNIKGTLGSNKNYENDNEPYTKLREAWWSANRDQIWKAMTCSAPDTADLYTRNSSGEFSFHRVKCGRDSYVPPDDYIPQKLRWMTEWSESYCKQLEKNYWLLKGFCQVCKKHKEKVKNKDAEKAACTFCSKSCEVYKDHVEKWKTQWEEQEKEYNKLYKPNGASSGDPIKEQEKDFMKTVKDTNGIPHCTGKKYATIPIMIPFGNPNKYDKECEEDTKQTNLKPPPGAPGFPPTCIDNPCCTNNVKKVKDCIKANEEKRKSQNGDCNEKKGDFDWKCEESEFKSGENGAYYRDLCLNKDIGKKNPNGSIFCKEWICALSNTVGDSEKDEVQQKL